MAVNENIAPYMFRSGDEAREKGAKGGRKSGESRRARKTFREMFTEALACKIPKDSPLYQRTVKQMRSLGLKGEPTVQHTTILGMIVKASKDHNAFVAVRDTVGEKPVETFENLTPDSPIILGTIPEAEVEAAMQAHQALQDESDREAAERGL